MTDLTKLSVDERYEQLKKFVGNIVKILYDYPDLPDGQIGPVEKQGYLSSIESTTFSFRFDNGTEANLSIEGVLQISSV